MAYLDPDQVKASMLKDFGEELGRRMYWLENAFKNLNSEWRIFRELFATRQERVAAFNAASGLVAEYFSKSLFETVLLGLCRMTDPAKTGRGAGAKENLSLESIIPWLPEELREEYGELVEHAKTEAEFARDWRNRLIAHSDLHVATQTESVDRATTENVSAALEVIDAAFNFVNQRLRGSETIYSDPILPLDDEESFLRTLYLGNQAWEENLEKRRIARQKNDWAELGKLRIDFPDWVFGNTR